MHLIVTDGLVTITKTSNEEALKRMKEDEMCLYKKILKQKMSLNDAIHRAGEISL